MSNAGAHLMGATTYAVMAAHWPGASGPFAKPMNEIPKVVFSHSLASADWGETTIVAGDLAEAITQIAHRAREHVAARRPRRAVSRTEQQQVVERFVAASPWGTCRA